MSSYLSNASTYPAYSNGYMYSNVSPNGYFPHPGKKAATTHAMMENTAQPQNYYQIVNSIPYDLHIVTIPMIHNGHKIPVCLIQRPISSGIARIMSVVTLYTTPQADMLPITGSNLPPSCSPPIIERVVLLIHFIRLAQHMHPPAPTMNHPRTIVNQPPTLDHPLIILRRITARGQWHNPVIGDPQLAGSSLPEQLGPSMAPSPSAVSFSQPYIGHGGDLKFPTSWISYPRNPPLAVHYVLLRLAYRRQQDLRISRAPGYIQDAFQEQSGAQCVK
ncbi:hypothetical protein EDB19DRAFT_2042902 [Suillus lakei]|nr:hypothetical protein EDB19DRAFT_2042902 [Suillus lakei]